MIAASSIRDELSGHQVENDWPELVEAWDVEVGYDATGDPAVWVWVVLRDDAMTKALPAQTRDALQERVREVVHRAVASTDVMVYVRFRSVTEHQAIAGKNVAR